MHETSTERAARVSVNFFKLFYIEIALQSIPTTILFSKLPLPLSNFKRSFSSQDFRVCRKNQGTMHDRTDADHNMIGAGHTDINTLLF